MWANNILSRISELDSWFSSIFIVILQSDKGQSSIV